MSKSFITADHHFFHENIIKYTGRPFAGVEEMHEVMIRYWNEVVGPYDLVWHLGDFCMSGHLDDMKQILGSLNGEKILILGNHDTYKKEEYLRSGFKEVYAHPIIIHKVLLLSHEPLAMSEDMPYYNLHGHTHDRDMMENADKRRNVSVEKTGFYPVNLGKILNDVLKKMNAKPVKRDLSEQNRTAGEPVVKNRETRKAIADAVAGNGLSRTYDNIEEMFDDLDAAYDDYPEITQQDFDRAVKRKGLKPFPADKKD